MNNITSATKYTFLHWTESSQVWLTKAYEMLSKGNIHIPCTLFFLTRVLFKLWPFQDYYLHGNGPNGVKYSRCQIFCAVMCSLEMHESYWCWEAAKNWAVHPYIKSAPVLLHFLCVVTVRFESIAYYLMFVNEIIYAASHFGVKVFLWRWMTCKLCSVVHFAGWWWNS